MTTPTTTDAPARPGRRRLLATAAAGGTVLGLSGCAGWLGPPQLTAEVASFGEWAAGRRPGRYAFERLPSQQARAAEQAQLEQAAQPALAAAGFVPVEAGAEPEYVVQLGVRVTRVEPSPWHDPLWWHGTLPVWRTAPWVSLRWGPPGWAHPWRDDLWRLSRTESEVAVLIRERASGKPLYEARAVTDSGRGSAVLGGLMAAALKDFPSTGLNPRRVTVPLAP
jgi:hypothetical protein